MQIFPEEVEIAPQHCRKERARICLLVMKGRRRKNRREEEK
jgi:hypothetical protein